MSGTSSAILHSNALKVQQRYDDIVYQNNLEEMEREKGEVLRQFEHRKDRVQKKVKTILGQQNVAWAAKGVQIGSDVAAEIAKETIMTGHEDVVALRNNAWKSVFGLESKALESKIRLDAARVGRSFERAAKYIEGFSRDAETFTPKGGK